MEPLLAGRRIRIVTLGCRTNLSEAEALASAMEARGASFADDASWDAAVLVSCSVTGEADRKCRQAIRRLRREQPGGLLVVCGCWAQAADEEQTRALGVDILVGNRRKSDIPELVTRCLSERSPGQVVLRGDVRNDMRWDGLRGGGPVMHTRAFVKVQDGCDHFCSYCIIPYVRGRSVSRPTEDVLDEIRSVAAAGCREVVLSGIHLGDYRPENGESLAALVARVAETPGVGRIRFGSLEPFSVDETLLRVLSDTPAFCRHLHLPLQSGDDGILARMRRGHTARDFLDLVARIRRSLGDDVHISTDVLVGFPGETPEAFDNTLRVLERARIGRTHAFPFSPRKGTPAASYPDRVPDGILSERVHRVRDASDARLAAYARRFSGRTVRMLVEGGSDAGVEGLIPEYLRVEATGSAEAGTIANVLVAETRGELLKGRVIPS